MRWRGCLTSDSISPGIDGADFDPEGDILILKKLLNDDISFSLPLKELHFEGLNIPSDSEEFLDRNPRSLEDEPDKNDLKYIVKLLDTGNTDKNSSFYDESIISESTSRNASMEAVSPSVFQCMFPEDRHMELLCKLLMYIIIYLLKKMRKVALDMEKTQEKRLKNVTNTQSIKFGKDFKKQKVLEWIEANVDYNGLNFEY
ncbi:hypothetical protein Tco_1281778 [Tanacetum coccineum]